MEVTELVFLRRQQLKVKLRVLLAGHTVAMITYCVMKMITTSSTSDRAVF